MCGLAGYMEAGGFSAAQAASTLTRMTDRLVHRGPDDAGLWFDEAAGIALGHRRLSIIDLSDAGHQPMASGSGRYLIAFNGECYNHQELRGELTGAGFEWRGHSDTETILAGFERWGIEETLRRMVGMFALALWDRRERTLTLARDRMGEKPLYYGWHGRSLLFGSELKAMREHPSFRSEVDRDIVALFLRHGYIPSPHSIYRGTRKLLPGTFVQFSGSVPAGELPDPTPYWSLREVASNALHAPFDGSMTEAVDELERRLAKAISLQMVADVPLGAFLSGGIDSSLVVSLMQAQSSIPVRTFTIGFHHQEFNEAEHAKEVARHLGTDHTELYVTPSEALEVIPSLPTLYDEPFGDASAVPTHLVSRLAREHVTVSLSGDGGDELFFGYGRYPRSADLCRRVEALSSPVRSVAPLVLDAGRRAATGALRPLWPRAARIPQMERKALRAAEILRAGSAAEVYRHLLSHWSDPLDAVPGATDAATPFTRNGHPPGLSVERILMYLDGVTLLPDDILTKVDRAAMGVSLETRVPFLDHRVVEFAQSLPVSLLRQGGQGKTVLRRLLERHVPRSLFDRPKQGFGIPISHWMRGPLREWAEDLLEPRRLREEGIFDEPLLTRRWTEYVSGGATWEYQIWDVLMYQAWSRSLEGTPAAP